MPPSFLTLFVGQRQESFRRITSEYQCTRTSRRLIVVVHCVDSPSSIHMCSYLQELASAWRCSQSPMLVAWRDNEQILPCNVAPFKTRMSDGHSHIESVVSRIFASNVATSPKRESTKTRLCAELRGKCGKCGCKQGGTQILCMPTSTALFKFMFDLSRAHDQSTG
jgi:hypothetical protein